MALSAAEAMARRVFGVQGRRLRENLYGRPCFALGYHARICL
jgi:hypothetical protein